MNQSTAENSVQSLFLDLNAFFASLAAVLVMVALGGCGFPTREQGQAQHAPYSHDSGSDMRGGADSGGGGGM